MKSLQFHPSSSFAPPHFNSTERILCINNVYVSYQFTRGLWQRCCSSVFAPSTQLRTFTLIVIIIFDTKIFRTRCFWQYVCVLIDILAACMKINSLAVREKLNIFGIVNSNISADKIGRFSYLGKTKFLFVFDHSRDW